MSARLGAGVRTIQLSSESPLTFPMANPNLGISDAIDAAIHTDLPAHPYSGAFSYRPTWDCLGTCLVSGPDSLAALQLQLLPRMARRSEAAWYVLPVCWHRLHGSIAA